MSGLLIAICLCVLIEPAVELPVAEETRPAVARLLVARSPEDAVKVFELATTEDWAPAELAEVPLSPLMFLLEGDELEIPEEASAVLLCFADSTRQRHIGPTRLRMEAQGIAVLTGETEPEIEQAHVLTAPLEVSDRTSQRGAVSVLRHVSDDVPFPEYPDYVRVGPGEVTLRWTYAGTEGSGTLVVQNDDGTEVLATEVVLPAGRQAVTVEAGKSYFWWIELADDGAVPALFTVLAEDEWQLVQEALTACGVPVEETIEGLAAVDSIDDLAYLIAVFQYYGMRQEAEAATSRLIELLEPEQ